MRQMSLFDVELEYLRAGTSLTNEALYQRLAERLGLSEEDVTFSAPVGEKATPANLFKRKVRWHQQTLKAAGVLERVEGERGLWRMSGNAKTELKENLGKISVVAFSTELGAAIWGLCEPVFKGIDAPITLCLTSPPYLLRKARAYGNIQDEGAYIDFVCRSLEPVVSSLIPGGSICLNISNDCFLPGSPARSLYREKLVIALHERLGLFKVDELIWANPNKPPGPVQWASISRQQLNTGYEPIYWFTNDPERLSSDNRRVLLPHTEQHLAFLRSDHRPVREASDGAYRHTKNSYRNVTAGRIPRNILSFSSNCGSQRQYKRNAKKAGLPAHGAPMPLELAKFMIELITAEDDLIVDIFGGSATTGLAAEQLGRRWLVVEAMHEYSVGSALRFCDRPDFRFNREMLELFG